MSYIDKNLVTGEQILYRTRKSLIIFISPCIWTALALFCLFLGGFMIKVAMILGIVAAGSWARFLLEYVTAEYGITSKRIMMREGFFFRHLNETRLSTVANISIDQSLLGRILNYGTVSIHNFGGGADPFPFISAPNALYKAMQAQLLNQDK